MAGYLNTLGVGAPIAPKDTRHRYPTHYDTFGLGGYRTVDLLTERDAIPTERKKIGMLVYVTETDATYRWINSTWEEVKVKLIIESADNSVSFDDINKLKLDTNTGLNFYNDEPGSVTISTQKAFTELKGPNDSLYSFDSQTAELVETQTIIPSITGNSIEFKTKTYSYKSTLPQITHYINHNLGTNLIICNIYIKDGTEFDFVIAPYKILDLNNIEITFSSARNIMVNVIPLEPINL